MKTSWRRLEDVLKTYGQDEYVGLDQDVLKTPWTRKAKANIFVIIKTSSEDENERRHHQDECLLGTSYVNSQLSNSSSSKISTSLQDDPNILTIKKLSQSIYQKFNNKKSEKTSGSDVSYPALISDENDESSTQSILLIHFLLLLKVNFFLTQTLVFFMSNFSIN